MINIEQITARLAKMPDHDLQQYAMMHKSDPYIMSLALSESNRRKQLRASAQTQSAQPQPKVADTALAGMTPQPAAPSPEEAGIAALPAGNMNFADGGIVAFAGGGTSYETPYDRMNRENRERQAAISAAAPTGTPTDTSPYSYGYEPLSAEKQAALKAKATPPAVTSLNVDLAKRAQFKQMNNQPLTSAETTALENSKVGSVFTPGAGIAGAMPVGQTGVEGAAPVGEKPAGLGSTAEATALRSVKTPGTGQAPSAGIGGPSIDEAKKLSNQFLDTKAAEARYNQFYKDEEAAANTARARRDEGKPEGKAYSKYEEMLTEEGKGEAKERNDALGLSLLTAGFSMMATGNIGKGAVAGADLYGSAMKDIKKATKERQKAFAEIENARRAEDRDDWKTKNAAEDKRDEHLTKAREFGIKGIMDITGKDAEIASGIYKTQVEQKGRLDVAHVQGGYQLKAADTRAAVGGDKQQLAELKALQGSLANQLKTEFNKEQRMAINAQLARVNSEIEKMAGLGTMAAAPGAASPGGTSTTGWGKAQVVKP